MIPFSVLISVYKKENPSYLRECLKSVFSQTLLANEVILVKDGPLSEDLDKVINEFQIIQPTLKIIKLDQNQGLGNALNEGIKYCSYDYIARMDSDDICFPNRFERQILYLEKHPDIDIVGTYSQEFSEDQNGLKTYNALKKFPISNEECYKYAKKRNPMEHPTVIFKKSSIMTAGGYMHCYLFEDYYMWIRMFLNKCTFHNISEPLLYFRMTKESFRRRGGWNYVKAELRALRTFKSTGFYTPTQYWKNIITRIPVRLMPNIVRKYIYNLFLRNRK